MDSEVREAERVWIAAGGGRGWGAPSPWGLAEQGAYLDALRRAESVYLPDRYRVRVGLTRPSMARADDVRRDRRRYRDHA